MKLTDEQKEIMKEDMTEELITMLMASRHYSMNEAMDVLYNSDTFSRLEDDNTGLYYQSPGYVYSYLNQELTTGDYRS
ncbi:hypothetical protein [Hallella absiana]|jgi:hypothetical protein|uniref:hypothetical protein n=1 Tax=Hallella absiana TaxID=2925336 RepID=UPI0021C93201|nr:hypothetical protein [Hallella absiana]